MIQVTCFEDEFISMQKGKMFGLKIYQPNVFFQPSIQNGKLHLKWISNSNLVWIGGRDFMSTSILSTGWCVLGPPGVHGLDFREARYRAAKILKICWTEARWKESVMLTAGGSYDVDGSKSCTFNESWKILLMAEILWSPDFSHLDRYDIVMVRWWYWCYIVFKKRLAILELWTSKAHSSLKIFTGRCRHGVARW